MSMGNSGNVAVFWDYENCPVPTNTSGYAIANSISSLARSFGTVKVFKAYLEISDQSRSSLRSELQSSGVSLVDCPHNGRKDVADKMILVDMLSYAIDNPAPSTIFLITGDRDFAYALSVLKNRHYRVVLVKRPETHVSLTFQACICFDWYDDVVHQAENPSSQAEKSTQRAFQRHRQFSDPTCNPLSSRPSPWHPASEGSNSSGADIEGTVDIVDYLRDRISDRVPPLQDHPQVSTATDQSPRQDQAVSPSPKRHRGPSFSTSRDTSNQVLAQEKQQTYLIAPKLQSTQPTKDVLSSISPMSSPLMWPVPALPTTPNPIAAQRVVPKETEATLLPAALPVSEELTEKFLEKEPANNTTPTTPSSANPAISSPSPKPSTSGDMEPSVEYSVTPEPTDARAVDPASSNDPSQGLTASGPGQSTEPLDTLVVPPNFAILVEALQSERSRGTYVSLCSVISLRISKNRSTYRNAGVSSFRQYCLLAEQAGIVGLGGVGNHAWICLKPNGTTSTS